MTVTFRIEKEDLRDFRRYARYHTTHGRRLLYTLAIWNALLTLLVTSGMGGSYLVRIISFVLFFLFLSLVGMLLTRVFTLISQWRMFTPEKLKGVFCEHTIILADDWIIEQTEVNEDKRSWNGVYKIVESDKYVYIFLSPVAAHVIPKRFFQSPAQAREFYNKAVELHQKSMAA